MRLHILSDLHQEFRPYQPREVEADVIILAGDTNTGLNGIRWAQKAFPNKPVVYIAGNHEWYGKNYHSHLKRMREAAKDSNVHFLENDVFEIDGVAFLGATLWTDLNYLGNVPLAMVDVRKGMNDFVKIRIEPDYRKLRPSDLVPIHQKTRAWLGQVLKRYAGQKTVVVTHHAISRKSVPEMYANDPCQPAYTSELTGFILDHPSKLWIHGHIHVAFDYTIGDTRVRANPRGYPGETENNGFNPDLVMEV